MSVSAYQSKAKKSINQREGPIENRNLRGDAMDIDHAATIQAPTTRKPGDGRKDTSKGTLELNQDANRITKQEN